MITTPMMMENFAVMKNLPSTIVSPLIQIVKSGQKLETKLETMMYFLQLIDFATNIAIGQTLIQTMTGIRWWSIPTFIVEEFTIMVVKMSPTKKFTMSQKRSPLPNGVIAV